MEAERALQRILKRTNVVVGLCVRWVVVRGTVSLCQLFHRFTVRGGRSGFQTRRCGGLLSMAFCDLTGDLILCWTKSVYLAILACLPDRAIFVVQTAHIAPLTPATIAVSGFSPNRSLAHRSPDEFSRRQMGRNATPTPPTRPARRPGRARTYPREGGDGDLLTRSSTSPRHHQGPGRKSGAPFFNLCS